MQVAEWLLNSRRDRKDAPPMAPSRARSMALRILIDGVAIYLILASVAYVFQRKLQYFPGGGEARIPPAAAYQGIEDVTVTASDGVRLKAWYWPGSRPVEVLIFHGNAGHRGHRLEWMEALHSLGLGVCVLDYRGYDGSEGSPSEEGFYRDAEAIQDWLRSRTPHAVVYVGESLGSGVAVELARSRPPAALIIQSGFSSAVDVAQRAYPFLPVRLLMKDRFDNLAKIGAIKVPLLVIHGEADTIVPLDSARALLDAAAGPKEWFGIPGADHNDPPWAADAEYGSRIEGFLRKYLGMALENRATLDAGTTPSAALGAAPDTGTAK